MHTINAWTAYTNNIRELLADLLKDGKITKNDTVWQGPDGTYGAGDPTLAQEDDPGILEMTEAGTVAGWLEEK